jgi:transposase
LEALFPGRLAWRKGAGRMGRPLKYPLELQERAVRMVAESGRPIRHVADDLGIHPESLRLWVRRAEVDETPRSLRVLPTDVERELKELRKRNAELERSNQILREASLLFAAELDQTRRR